MGGVGGGTLLSQNASYFKIAASLERRAVLPLRFLVTLLSNSFLTRDATESRMTNLTRLEIMSSSNVCSLKSSTHVAFGAVFIGGISTSYCTHPMGVGWGGAVCETGAN